MFYKKIEDSWEIAKSVKTPKGDLKKGESLGGWKWLDEPPLEYLEWKKSLEEQEENDNL